MTLPVQDVPLLITSAINVEAPNTKLSDSGERLLHTLAALGQWLALGAFKRIVVCDGSNFDLTSHMQDLKQDANTDVTFEALHFQNDAALVKKLGKGFGEGQIVDHALAHSHILATTMSFAKCTSKLWATNAAACLRRYNGTAALNLAGGFTPVNVDTRFYICSKTFYRTHLQDCHQRVDESHGIYLEHRFFEAIQSTRIYRNAISPTPVIAGISGSMGKSHQTSRLNNLAKNVRNNVLRLAGQ